MKKTQRKDAVRNIRKRLVSYLSVCLVIMLGLGGFFITRYMGAGISARAIGYYKESSFKNYELISSLGITDDDLAQIKEVEGITDAEGVIRADGTLKKGDLKRNVEIISMTERISVPETVEGRAPSAKDECMIGEDFAFISGLRIGDKVRLSMPGLASSSGQESEEIDLGTGADSDEEDEEKAEKEEESSNVLFSEEFTVTGLMKHPDYLRRKSVNTVVLPWAAYNMDATDGCYTHAFLLSEEPEGVDIFSEKYFEKTAGTKKTLEDLTDVLAEDSAARAKRKAYARIDEEWQKALAEFGDAQNEIDENETSLNDELAKARKDLEDAQKELDSKVSDANKKIRNGEEKIRSAEKEILAGEKKISAGEKEIEDNEAKIKDAEKEIKKNEAKIKDGEDQIKEAKENLKLIDDNLPDAKKYIKDMREQYEGDLDSALRKIATAQDILDKLKELDLDSEEYQTAVKELAKFIIDQQDTIRKVQEFSSKDEVTEIAEKIRDVTGIDATGTISIIKNFDTDSLISLAENVYENGGSIGEFVKKTQELIDSINKSLEELDEYDGYIKEYEAKRSDLYKQVAQKEKELAAAKKELANAKKELAAGRKKLAEAKKELANGRKKLAEARKELADGRKKLAKAKKELASEKSRYQAQIKNGWSLYYTQKAEYESKLEEAKALLAENREEAEIKLVEAKAEVENIECKWLVLDRRANAGYIDVASSIAGVNSAGLAFGLLFILISSIVCFSTLTIIIEEQKKMVGTVKAFGFHKGEILSKYLVFGVTAAAVGCIAGIIIALGLSGFVLGRYNEAGMYLFGEAKSVITPVSTVAACICMILVCALATVIACTDILKSPASVLMKGGSSRKGSGKKNASPKKGGSLYSRLIVRNMFEDKVRVIISIAIIAFSTVLVGTGISMKLAFDGMTQKQVTDVYKYDIRVDLSDKVTDEQKTGLTKVLSEDGTDFTFASYETHLYRWNDNLDVLNVLTGKPDELKEFFAVRDIKTDEELALPDDGVLVQKKMKESYGMTEGRTIPVMDSGLELKDAAVKGYFQNYVGRIIITSPDGYRNIFGENPVYNCYYVRANGTDIKKLESELLAVTEDVSFEEANEFASKFEAVSFLYNMIVYLCTGIAILMSFMILTNLANIFLNRKKTELTVMRINGFSIKQTRGYLAKETVVTAAVGVALGVLIGSVLAPLIIRMVEQPDLQFVRTFHPAAWIIAVILEVIFAIVINSLVFRKVKDLNLRDVA